MANSPSPAFTSRSQRLDRFGPAIALLLLGVYFSRAGLEAASRPLWFDEYFTFHLARLRFGDLWQALLGAADALPPLSFLLTGALHGFLGTSELVTRLPSILGWALFGFCLYLLLKPRVGVIPALAAMVFSWLTWGFEYAVEARPYALMTGFGAAALLAWRETADGKRQWGLPAMTLSLAAAISLHYYAVFVFLPPAAGEAVRAWRSRKFDWLIWAGMAAAGAVLLLYLPLIQAGRNAYSGGFWSPVHETDIFGTYMLVLLPAAWPLGIVVVLLIGVTFYLAARKAPDAPVSNGSAFPAHETAALLTAAAIPIFAVALAYLTTGVYVYRYALPVLVGICAGFGVFVQRGSHGRFGVQWVVLGILAGWFALGGPRFVPGEQGRINPGSEDPYGFAALQDPRIPADLPIVVGSPVLFPEVVHYAPKSLKDRLIYVADPEAALRYREADTPDRNLLGLGRWAGFTVVLYDAFLARREEFLIQERPRDRFGWLLERLQDEGRAPTLLIDGPLQVWKCCDKNGMTPSRRTSTSAGRANGR